MPNFVEKEIFWKRPKRAGEKAGFNEKIAVSVIVPAMNEEKFIGKCLQSLASQTMPRENYEIIVSDSSSTDSTVKIAKKYADKVVICRRQSAGYGKNRGAKYAVGKNLLFIDADTIADKKWAESANEVLQSTIACTGPVRALEDDSLKLTIAFLFWQCLTRVSVFFGFGLMPGHNMGVRKKAFMELNEFIEDNITNEDNDFSKRIRKKGRIIYSNGMAVRTSTRRLKKISIITYFLNGVKFFLFGKSMTWNDFRDDY
ncbi:MAG: glycosyltransferase [Candidatus Diapherotrites archaeon]|nr:glycosyltransferase [Candidatus Diapherotrites archaeon]